MGLTNSLVRELGRRSTLLRAVAWMAAHPGRVRQLREQRRWLFGAAAGAALTDNSAALFDHVKATTTAISCRWVTDGRSADARELLARGEALLSSATATVVESLCAEVHLISHGIHDVPGSASRLSQATRVRLGHGLTAFKRTKPAPLRTQKGVAAKFNLVPVASEFELAHKRTWGIPDACMAITGLPRFDPLLRKARARPAGGRRTVLFAPTWRDWRRDLSWMAPIARFVSSPLLADLLAEHDAELRVWLHPNIPREALEPFQDRPHVSAISRFDPQDELARCSVLITDYSSVAWDALYIDTPVIFFHFDVNEYLRERGSYVDLLGRLFGPKGHTPEELVSLLGKRLERSTSSEEEEDVRAWQARAFRFRDDANCARVLTSVESRVERRSSAFGRHRR